MLSERHVNTLRHGDAFRGWLVDIVGERIRNKKCNVAVHKISPASHTVCRYEFVGENYSVVAKFYAEPTGWLNKYDPAKSMQIEFDILRRMEGYDVQQQWALWRKGCDVRLATRHSLILRPMRRT